MSFISAKAPFSLFFLLSIACLSKGANGREYTFNPDMLGDAGKDADITLLSQGVQPPGVYTVDVILNGKHVDTREVDFRAETNAQGKVSLYPCLAMSLLSAYGVRTEDYPALSAEGECVKLSVIPQASVDYQFYNQQLLMSIPQVALRSTLTGIAPQQLWDDGIPALLLNYSANTYRTESLYGVNTDSNSTYIQLNPGANLGAWRLRNQTNWQKQGGQPGKWQTVQTYAERGLYDMKSRLTLGERVTPSDVFSSVPFSGVMLGSDDLMVPYNQRAFAPVVRGIARTQARIEVKQNGYTIYNNTVAPGPFALTDLPTSGASSGDLQVTVWETDGRPQVFAVPYQTPAISLREGYLKFNMMAGRYRPSDSAVDKSSIGQASVMYGLPWGLTVYGGLQGAEKYQAASLGMGMSLGDFGAVSLDGNHSSGQKRAHDTERGSAWRVRYSKEVLSTNTTLTVGSYQYASSGYSTLNDVLDTWRSDGSQREWWGGNANNDRRKSDTSLTLSQSFGQWGNLNLNGTRTTYWNHSGGSDSFGVSYGLGIANVSLSLNWSRNNQISNTGQHRTDNLSSLSVSMPLERWFGGQTRASYQLTQSDSGTTNEAKLSGRAFDRQLSWDVGESYRSDDSQGDRASSALRLTWFGTYGQLGGNYRYSQHQRQMGADVAGGMIVHRNGITLGQPQGETMALVSAPGASAVQVGGYPGVKTDVRGYATQGYMTPYQENIVSLDPLSFPPDVDVLQTDQKVVPTQGAIISTNFLTRSGGRALITLIRADGELVPFGAQVKLEGQSVSAGVVGDAGQAYLTGLPEQGKLVLRWSGQQCLVEYRLPAEVSSVGMYVLKGICR